MTALRDRATKVQAVGTLLDARTVPTSTDGPDGAELRVSAERQRIALALHDEIGPLLFAMASRVRRAQEQHDSAELRTILEVLAAELEATQDRLRSVIRDCSPTLPAETVPVATQRDIEAFTDRTGVPSHLVLRSRPEHLPPAVERVALNCLRQALFNVERHAQASLVVVTLDYRVDRFRLVVQDDGLGLPAGFEPRAIPSDGHHWGFTSMAEQVERLGGSVELRRVEEGGTQLGVELPVRISR